MGMGGDANQPVALCVGAIVCIAAANAGATSQDLKTGFLVGATPIRQQIGLVIGVLVSVVVIGLTIKGLDTAFADPAKGELHGIGGPKFPAPQATLMATIIKGVMSQNLAWSFLLVGAGLSPDRLPVRRLAARLGGRRLPADQHDLPDLPRRHAALALRQDPRPEGGERDLDRACCSRPASSPAAR